MPIRQSLRPGGGSPTANSLTATDAACRMPNPCSTAIACSAVYPLASRRRPAASAWRATGRIGAPGQSSGNGIRRTCARRPAARAWAARLAGVTAPELCTERADGHVEHAIAQLRGMPSRHKYPPQIIAHADRLRHRPVIRPLRKAAQFRVRVIVAEDRVQLIHRANAAAAAWSATA